MSTKRNLRRELLIWGYIRATEKEYNLLYIPLEINDIIYLFQQFYEIWSKKYSNPGLIINEDGTKFTIPNDRRYTAYGDTVVNEGIFVWKLKIVIMNHKYNDAFPYVGLIMDSEDKLLYYQDVGHWNEHGYQLCAGNSGLFCESDTYELYYNSDSSDAVSTEKYNCIWRKSGDILEIILDLNQGTIQFIVNDKDCGIAFRNIKKTSYRLAITNKESSGSQFVLI